MCVKIPLENKVQTSNFLPKDWVYCFDPPASHSRQFGGLAILNSHAKNVKRYRSFENATLKHGNVFKASNAAPFYDTVGLTKEYNGAPSPSQNIIATARPSAGRASNIAVRPWYSEKIDFAADKKVALKRDPLNAGTWSLKKLYDERCKNCLNCRRAPCAKCDTCLRNEGEVCLRRVSKMKVKDSIF